MKLARIVKIPETRYIVGQSHVKSSLTHICRHIAADFTDNITKFRRLQRGQVSNHKTAFLFVLAQHLPSVAGNKVDLHIQIAVQVRHCDWRARKKANTKKGGARARQKFSRNECCPRKWEWKKRKNSWTKRLPHVAIGNRWKWRHGHGASKRSRATACCTWAAAGSRQDEVCSLRISMRDDRGLVSRGLTFEQTRSKYLSEKINS